MTGEIFISYRRADEVWARFLHRQLRAEGVEAWYDALVGPGQDWRGTTAKALEASQIFVLLFSENAAQSREVVKELAAATHEQKLVVPVRLQNIEPKGAFLYELASRNWVNAYEDTDTKLAELAKGLAQLVRTGARDESVLPFERSADRKPGAMRRMLWPAASAAVFALAAIAAWLLWPEPKWTVQSSRPLIATLELEDDPAFSPNGTLLAYSSGTPLARKIYVRNMAGGDGIKISTDDYDDTAPSWSSDGSHLAYIARKSGEPCHIMMAAVPAGGVREVGRCRKDEASSVAWQANTSFIFFIDEQDDGGEGIYRLNLDTGTRDPILTPKIGSFIDLRCSPDGHRLLYLTETLTPGTVRVMVRDLANGQEKAVMQMLESPTAVWDNSATWSEDGKSVLVSVANGGGSEITAYPLDGGKPYSIYSSPTPIGHLAAGPIARLAIVTNVSRKNLARAIPAPAQQPDVIDVASGITFSPSFAQDGTLAFLSNRNGANALWVQKPGKPPALLFDAGADAPFRAAIAPDGRHIAIASFELDHGIALRILTAEGASSNSIHVDLMPPGFPTWTPDSKALVLFDATHQQAVRVDIDNPSHRTPVAPPAWVGVTVRNDGTYATLFTKPGVWRIDGGEKLISAKYPRYFNPPLAFRGSELLIPDFSAEQGARILAQPLAGGPDRVLAYAPGAEDRDYQSKMTVNPTNGEIIYVASVARDTNIDLLTLVRH